MITRNLTFQRQGISCRVGVAKQLSFWMQLNMSFQMRMMKFKYSKEIVFAHYCYFLSVFCTLHPWTHQEDVLLLLEGLRTWDSDTLPIREAAWSGSGFSEDLLCIRWRHKSCCRNQVFQTIISITTAVVFIIVFNSYICDSNPLNVSENRKSFPVSDTDEKSSPSYFQNYQVTRNYFCFFSGKAENSFTFVSNHAACLGKTHS